MRGLQGGLLVTRSTCYKQHEITKAQSHWAPALCRGGLMSTSRSLLFHPPSDPPDSTVHTGKLRLAASAPPWGPVRLRQNLNLDHLAAEWSPSRYLVLVPDTCPRVHCIEPVGGPGASHPTCFPKGWDRACWSQPPTISEDSSLGGLVGSRVELHPVTGRGVAKTLSSVIAKGDRHL